MLPTKIDCFEGSKSTSSGVFQKVHVAVMATSAARKVFNRHPHHGSTKYDKENAKITETLNIAMIIFSPLVEDFSPHRCEQMVPNTKW